ncbi:hypothetical protein [Rhizobium leguminosarum]|uniref:hypothetical protein n=1 Tax=Rhizobium leguminosarum TaxID=384 RepID=UPI001FE0939C|nr:hypothetical protein [Rhizobium leguminosarum]
MSGYTYRDALRLLFILVRGSQQIDAIVEQEWDSVFVGEKRALAIDFWVRYPDYLADELLDRFERDCDLDALDAARTIFENEEPDVRQVKMIRWRRGAYDDLQTSLSVLTYRGLVRSMDRGLQNGMLQHEYLSGPAARSFLDEVLRDHPALRWYEKQTRLALSVAGTKSGSALKDIHYRDPEYGSTPYGSIIPSIRDRVRARLRKLEEKQDG